MLRYIWRWVAVMLVVPWLFKAIVVYSGWVLGL
jgi:hypothetical protein